MHNFIRGAALVGAVLLSAGCASGTVIDKRAPGQPGEKVFQLRVDGTLPSRWVTVSERTWEMCPMFDEYPDCQG
jgi:hypothetical protein